MESVLDNGADIQTFLQFVFPDELFAVALEYHVCLA